VVDVSVLVVNVTVVVDVSDDNVTSAPVIDVTVVGSVMAVVVPTGAVVFSGEGAGAPSVVPTGVDVVGASVAKVSLSGVVVAGPVDVVSVPAPVVIGAVVVDVNGTMVPFADVVVVDSIGDVVASVVVPTNAAVVDVIVVSDSLRSIGIVDPSKDVVVPGGASVGTVVFVVSVRGVSLVGVDAADVVSV